MAERLVDHNLIRTSQAFTVGLLVLAFVLDSAALAGFVGVVLLLSAINPALGLFRRFYLSVLRPAGLVQPHILRDNPEPHRFAQVVGGIVVTLGTLALLSGFAVAGWALIGVVIVLASLNLFAGWCAGCMVYYWLNRAGVPGFTHSRIGASQ
jgi:hypothetical protein